MFIVFNELLWCRYGWSANMQRIMQAQALGDAQRQTYMQGKKTIEINPRHPLIVGLLEKVQVDEEDESAKDTAKLLFETALLESGYPMQDNQAFAGRVWNMRLKQHRLVHLSCIPRFSSVQ